MNHHQYLPEYILKPFFKEEPIVGMEIGVMKGIGSMEMLGTLPKLFLYCVDTWEHKFSWRRKNESNKPQEWHDQNYKEAFLNTYPQFGHRCILFRMSSDEAFKMFDGPIDFVYIDGDHTGKQIRKDIRNWKSKLKPRSILAGHDWQFPHLQKIVKEELGEVKLGEDYIWWKEYE